MTTQVRYRLKTFSSSGVDLQNTTSRLIKSDMSNRIRRTDLEPSARVSVHIDEENYSNEEYGIVLRGHLKQAVNKHDYVDVMQIHR